MDLAKKKTSIGGIDQPAWLASTEGLDNPENITLDMSLFDPAVHYPNGWLLSGTPLAQHATTKLYGPYAGTTDEKQTVTITGTPTGGTFTLTYSGQTTAAIAYNATAAVVQAALVALPNVGAGNITVAGGPGPGTPYMVSFVNALADTDVAQMTTTSSLTGGSSPAVAVTTTTAGGADVVAALGVMQQFLYGAVPGKATGRVGAAGLRRCKVRESRLPLPVDANGKADVAGRVVFLP